MMRRITLILTLFIACFSITYGQSTIGLMVNEAGAYDGYTLYRPLRNTSTYLIDNCGRLVHEWKSPFLPGNSEFLLRNGLLLRTVKNYGTVNEIIDGNGGGEYVQLVDWDGNVIWEYLYNDSLVRMHHDIEPLPNGNVLILAWELHTYEESIAAGRDTSILIDSVIWSEQIIEVDPATDSIVWLWSLWDHLIQDHDSTKDNYGVVADHPELLNLNYTGSSQTGVDDWIHANAVAYDPVLDQVVMNSRNLSEFYVIDHSTTTAEAAGHSGGISGKGGDILYRWGNQAAYDRGTALDQKLFGAHDVHWIPDTLTNAGKIMVFNNGRNRPAGAFSSVEIIATPVDTSTGLYSITPDSAYGPLNPDYIYTADSMETFFATFISGARTLPNGNILVCEGSKGKIFELDGNDDIVWEYINPVGNAGVHSQGEIPSQSIVFRAMKYPLNYPGLSGHTLVPNEPIEYQYTSPYICDSDTLNSCRIPAALMVSNISSTSAKLSWETMPNAIGYEVTGGKVGKASITIQVGTSAQWTANGLTPNASYYWTVRSICLSNNDTFTTENSPLDTFQMAPPCIAPVPINESNLTSTGVTLNWTLVAGADGYRLFGRELGKSIQVFDFPNTQSSASVNTLKPGTTYEWTMKTICQGGELSDVAPVRTFTTPSSKTADPLTSNIAFGILLYPNPAKNEISIIHPGLSVEESFIELFSLDGKQLMREHVKDQQRTQLNVKNLSNGIYQLVIRSGNFVTTEKIVISK